MISLYQINEEDAFRNPEITDQDIGKWMVEANDLNYICNNKQAADRLIASLADEQDEEGR